MAQRFVLLCITFIISGTSIACYDAERIVSLGTEEGWSFREGFSEDWLNTDPGNWKGFKVPTNFRTRDDVPDDYAGSLTLRRELPTRLTEIAARSEALAFFSGRISDVAEFYINGERIAGVGSPPPEYASGSYRAVLADVSPRLFGQEPDVMHIRLYTNGVYDLNFHDTAIRIGPARDVYTAYYREEMISFALLVLYMAVGLYHLLLAIRRPQDIYNFYFGLFGVMISCYWFFTTASRDLLFGEHVLLRAKVEYVVLFTLGPLLLIFISQYFQRRYSKVGLVYSAVCAVAALAVTFGDRSVMSLALSLWQLTALPMLIYIAYFIGREAWRGDRDARYLLGGVLLITGAGIYDIAAARAWINSPPIGRYTFVVFIGGIAGVLAARFARVQNEVEELNANLERKVEDRTHKLQQTLSEVRELKVQQDGDYYLTSLLIQPLGGNFTQSDNVDVNFLVRQKKRFKFRRWEAEIGGDLCTAHTIELGGRRYTAVLNGDAMGKSIQGAGGALVLGTVFKSVIARTQVSESARNKSPERWLKDCFLELQNIFVSFDGSMLISAVLGLVDDDCGLFYYINAEHPWVVLYRDDRAQFIENQLLLRKIGIWGLDGKLRVQTFELRPNDVLLIGSDGRDDVQIGVDENGHRIINEDEYQFLRHVETGRGLLEGIHRSVQGMGALTDDFTLIRLAYREDAPLQQHEMPERCRALIQAGREDFAAARYGQALNAFEEASRELGDVRPLFEAELLPDLARSHAKLKHHTEAARYWLSYIDLRPEDNDALHHAAYSAKLAGRYADAREPAERLRLREPEHLHNLINLADTLRLLGESRRAQKVAEEALAIDPDNESALRLRELLSLQSA